MLDTRVSILRSHLLAVQYVDISVGELPSHLLAVQCVRYYSRCTALKFTLSEI
jgi:uncharacterized lipoprotein YbaY